MHLFSKSLKIQKPDGSFHTFLAPSITRTERFKAHHKELIDALRVSQFSDKPLDIAMKKDPAIESVIIDMLAIFDKNVSYKDFSVDTLFRLIFPHKIDEETYSNYGTLVEFVIGEQTDTPSKSSVVDIDAYAKVLAEATNLFNSFEEAVNLLDTLDYGDFAEMFKHYAKLNMTKDQKMQAESQEELSRAKSSKGMDMRVTELSEDEVNNLLGLT